MAPVSTQRQVQIPHSHIIQRSPSIQYSYPISMNSSRPTLTPKQQHFPN
jgi:hypothetical protein